MPMNQSRLLSSFTTQRKWSPNKRYLLNLKETIGHSSSRLGQEHQVCHEQLLCFQSVDGCCRWGRLRQGPDKEFYHLGVRDRGNISHLALINEWKHTIHQGRQLIITLNHIMTNSNWAIIMEMEPVSKSSTRKPGSLREKIAQNTQHPVLCGIKQVSFLEVMMSTL